MSKGKGRRGQQDSPTLWVAVGGILANILTQEQTVWRKAQSKKSLLFLSYRGHEYIENHDERAKTSVAGDKEKVN